MKRVSRNAARVSRNAAWVVVAGLVAAVAGGCSFGSSEPSKRSSNPKADEPIETNGATRRDADRDIHDLADAMALFAKDDPAAWNRGQREIESLQCQAIVPDWVHQCLRDASDAGARGHAARERLGRGGQTAIVLRRLDSPKYEDWDTARLACTAMGPDSTYALVDALVRKFSLSQAGQGERARAQLALIGEPAVPILGAYIEGSSGAGVKEQCALALAYMRGVGDAELLRVAQNSDDAVRRSVAMALGMSGTPQALQGCERIARTDSSWKVRAEAVKSLGKTRLPQTASALAACLHDEDPFVRRSAVEALGGYNCTEAVVALRDASRDPDSEVSAIAAKAFDRVLRTLVSMLRAKDRKIAAAAAQSLRDGTGQSLGSDPRSWEEYLRTHPR